MHVHPDPAVLGVHQRADLALTADPLVLARQLLELVDVANPSTDDPWWRDGHDRYLRVAGASAAPDGDGRLHPGRAIEAVRAVAPEETIVTNDAGNFSVFLHRQWMFRHPRTQAAPISGAMGYAVPGAIGAALARPGIPVLGVAGDGGFLMTATEIETAVRVGADVKILVLQNGLYGTIAMHQASSGRSVSACDIEPVDIESLSRSLGAKAATVDDEADLPAAAAELMGAEGPAVLVVRTDPDVIAPGRSLSAMDGGTR
ncbi:thiamine pyrophosphate-dependent enzyme [Spiractinospora alimapuensis]|uniref:thiamine pyrophosphate-dependent enzyme n=1 Tax=Spiractinospora alimapuensis TaxID=2820884 RepID=UPI002ED05B2C